MKFPIFYYIFPFICLLVAVFSQYSGLDIYLTQFFYDPLHHLWTYQNSWLTQTVLHDGAADVIKLIFMSIIVFFCTTFLLDKGRRYRRAAGYVIVASLTGIIIIAVLKEVTHLYTPWDLEQFGGRFPNIRLFDPVASHLPVGHAFPAGHASGGYALLSIYFAARYYQSRYSLRFLYAALAAGLILGIDQQIRGAHMLSHDLSTLAICWLSCLFWAGILVQSDMAVETTSRIEGLRE